MERARFSFHRKRQSPPCFAGLVAWAWFTGASCFAEDHYDIKVYPCPETKTHLVIDGRLSEPAWEQAPLVGGFTRYDRPELAKVQTFVRALFDARYLYLGVVCDEPRMDKLAPVAQARDSGEVFHGETIEIFIDPNHDHANYFQFGINAAGSVYDSRKTEATWNADVRAKTRLGKGQWTLEFAVPWKDLGVTPKQSAVVGFNVCRDRYVGGAREWTNWAQTKANFHDPLRFAHLVLAPTAAQLGALGDEFRKGGRRGRIVVYGREGFADTTYRELARKAVGRFAEALADLEKTERGEPDPATRAELERRLKGYRKQLRRFQKQVGPDGSLNAAEWTRLDLRLSQLLVELHQVVWKARLAALLAGI